jgi:hypothetical protein
VLSKIPPGSARETSSAKDRTCNFSITERRCALIVLVMRGADKEDRAVFRRRVAGGFGLVESFNGEP